MATFNHPALLQLSPFGDAMLIQRKRGKYPEMGRSVDLAAISSASFRRLMRLFEADVWTHKDGDRHEYRLLGRIDVHSNMHINEYGVEVSDHGNVPRCCMSCPFFEAGEVWDDGIATPWSDDFCTVNVFMPVRKGTCATKSNYLAKPHFQEAKVHA